MTPPKILPIRVPVTMPTSHLFVDFFIFLYSSGSGCSPCTILAVSAKLGGLSYSGASSCFSLISFLAVASLPKAGSALYRSWSPSWNSFSLVKEVISIWVCIRTIRLYCSSVRPACGVPGKMKLSANKQTPPTVTQSCHYTTKNTIGYPNSD